MGAAVIPIENSLAGSVSEHFDLLLTRNVFIQKEFLLRIVHNLIAAPGVRLKDIRRALRTRWRLISAGTSLRTIRKLDRSPSTTLREV